MILVVSHAGDDHAQPVLDALARRGAEAQLLDLGALPAHGTLALSYGQGVGQGQGETRSIQLEGQPPLDLHQVTAVWWRRARQHQTAPGLAPEHAAFAIRQTFDALVGLVGSLAPHALLLNDPWLEQRAGQKTYQLALARRLGLRLPETLVTSDPAAARAFLAALGEEGAVHKAIHCTLADWHRTRRIGPEDLSRLDDLRLAPVILQQRIPGVDVRVTVVGGAIFAAELDARGTPAEDDYRGHEALCRLSPCALPEAEAGALRNLVRALGLHYAAVDYRRRDDGTWFFLELNPSGQWTFVEDRTGQPITEAVAALLARPR